MTLRESLRPAALLGGAFLALYVYAWYATRRFEDLEPETAEPPGSFLDVDGVRLHYVEAGQGAPVVLIHGLGASTYSFRYTIPELAQRYRVVAFDLKGFGYSARPASGDYSLTAHAKLIAAAMRALGIERAAVVGHSLGGAIALRLASLCPERVDRLVLVDAATDRALQRGRSLAWLARPFAPIIALATLHRQRFRRFALRAAVHDPAHITPEVVEGYFRPSRMKGHARAFARLMAHRRRDTPVDLASVRAPTLVLWGEHDRWLPPSLGEELARALPNARLEVVPAAGHLPLEEQPGYSNRALLAFLGAKESTLATDERTDIETAAPRS